MEFLFLGTGAAEGVPAAYCRCPDCMAVRVRGGVELKTRSSLRVGEHHQIDISPDHYWQMLRHGTDMYDVEHVLVTHTHEDHFDFTALANKEMSRQTNGKPLAVWMSAPAKAYLESTLAAVSLSPEERQWIREHIRIEGLDYFGEYGIGGLTIQTVKGNHTARGVEERSINYLIGTSEGRWLLYGCDTGYYQEESWRYLAGRRVDVLVLECTFAGRTDRGELPSGHLDLASYLKTLERMASMGFIDERTDLYATHLNPHQGLDHISLQRRLDQSPFRVTVAYDGLRGRL